MSLVDKLGTGIAVGIGLVAGVMPQPVCGDPAGGMNYLAEQARKRGHFYEARNHADGAVMKAREEGERKAKEAAERETSTKPVKLASSNEQNLIRFSYNLSKQEGITIKSREVIVGDKKFIDLWLYNHKGKSFNFHAWPSNNKKNYSGGTISSNFLKKEGFKGICRVEFKDDDKLVDEFYVHLD